MPKARNSRGFSLTELLTVVGIILVVATLTAPNLVQAIRTYRVNAAAGDMFNMIQRTRYEAIRRNGTTRCRGQRLGTQWQIWIDYNNDRVVDANEPFILLSSDMDFLPQSDVPPPPRVYAVTQMMDANGIAFDSRGTVDFGPGGAPAVLLTYLGVPNNPAYGYRAIAVTPAGKSKIWRATRYDNWY